MRLRSSPTRGCQMALSYKAPLFQRYCVRRTIWFRRACPFLRDRRADNSPPCRWRAAAVRKEPARGCSVRAGREFAIMTREAPRRSFASECRQVPDAEQSSFGLGDPTVAGGFAALTKGRAELAA